MHENGQFAEPTASNGPLVDIFALWSCDEQRWLDGSPVLYRFEQQDVLVDGEGAVLARGAVPTPSPVDVGLLKALGAGPLDAVCWRRRAPSHPASSSVPAAIPGM